MPVLFIGHGSPMNAIEQNRFSDTWRKVGELLPAPDAILCVSAHWETNGPRATAMDTPGTIYDFSGFPAELYQVKYPAPGSPELAERICDMIRYAEVIPDREWGLDHGTWSVLRQMYPTADIPVVQLSMDYNQSASWHYQLARELVQLRQEGVLIIGSGNMVHNLRRIAFAGGGIADFNRPFGLDWAIEANTVFKDLILKNRHEKLTDYLSLGEAVRLAVPTPDHYVPLLYALAQKKPDETVVFFNDQAVGGSLTMTSLIISEEDSNEKYKKLLNDAVN